MSQMVEDEIEVEADADAEYTLESPVSCPSCRKAVTDLHVVRMLRTRVNFTSSLPRRGYVVICPACRGILPAGLGGLLG